MGAAPSTFEPRQDTNTCRPPSDQLCQPSAVPKALVDSERIITRLRAEGYEIARASTTGRRGSGPNTCGFLDSARDESLDAIWLSPERETAR